SEGFLDTLPPNRRDFLLATPDSATSGEDWPDSLLLDDDAASDDSVPPPPHDQTLPAWYQLGPVSAGQALAEVRAGLGVAGTTQANAVALWALAALGVAGGGIATLEVFFLIQSLGLTPFYLGALLAAEGAGLTLGALLGGAGGGEGPWRGRFLAGLAGSGVALAGLSLMSSLLFVLLACFALGVCNALAVQAARQGLLDGLDGVERRAVTAAENSVVALCAVVGTLAVAVLYGGDALPIRVPLSLASLPAANLLFDVGAGLVAATVVFALLLSLKPRGAEPATSLDTSLTGARLPALDGEDDAEDDDYLPATGEHDAWGESDAGDWTSAHRSRDTSYGRAAPRGRDSFERNGYDRRYPDAGERYDDEDEYDDDPPPRRRSDPARRPPREDRRPRW
ncbi:MAG: hypothetical protein ACRDHP_11095, partial [Ktedonobacterales bacterium]